MAKGAPYLNLRATRLASIGIWKTDLHMQPESPYLLRVMSMWQNFWLPT